jgi:hypothetical protein
MDRFAGAAPGNAPLFVQLKLYAWNAISDGAEEGKIGQDWETNSEMASSVQTSSTRRSRGIVDTIFRRKRLDEGQLRGKPIHHGDAIVVECDGRFATTKLNRCIFLFIYLNMLLFHSPSHILGFCL